MTDTIPTPETTTDQPSYFNQLVQKFQNFETPNLDFDYQKLLQPDLYQQTYLTIKEHAMEFSQHQYFYEINLVIICLISFLYGGWLSRSNQTEEKLYNLSKRLSQLEAKQALTKQRLLKYQRWNKTISMVQSVMLTIGFSIGLCASGYSYFLHNQLLQLPYDHLLSISCYFVVMALLYLIKSFITKMERKIKFKDLEIDKTKEKITKTYFSQLNPQLQKMIKSELKKVKNEQLIREKKELDDDLRKKQQESSELIQKITTEQETCKLIMKKREYYERELHLYQWFEKNLQSFAWCATCMSGYKEDKQDDEDDEQMDMDFSNGVCVLACKEKYFIHCRNLKELFEQKQANNLALGQQIFEKENLS